MGRGDYGVVNGCVKWRVNTLRMVRCFGKCNLERLVADLDAAPWQVIDTFDDMDSKWDYWKLLFRKIVDSHAPLKKARVRTKTLPLITRELHVLMRARNYHCNKAKKSGSEEDWKHYRELRNPVMQELRKENLRYFQALSEQPSNSKKTWKERNRLSECLWAGITLFSNLYGTHSSEGKGDREKRTSNRAWTWDLRSIAEFQPHELRRLVEILHPPSPLCTGHRCAAMLRPLTTCGSRLVLCVVWW